MTSVGSRQPAVGGKTVSGVSCPLPTASCRLRASRRAAVPVAAIATETRKDVVTVPIQALAEGTRRISGGDLGHLNLAQTPLRGFTTASPFVMARTSLVSRERNIRRVPWSVSQRIRGTEQRNRRDPDRRGGDWVVDSVDDPGIVPQLEEHDLAHERWSPLRVSDAGETLRPTPDEGS